MEIKIYHSTSRANLYQVDDILIEAGPAISEIKKSLNYKLSDISGCLISHSHKDHARAAKDIMQAGIDVYMAQETADELNLDSHRLHIIEPLKQFNLNGYRIKPFRLAHDVMNLGFIIQKDKEKILFAIDTNYIPFRFNDLTKIMIGVNYDRGIMYKNIDNGLINKAVGQRSFKNHMSIQTALEFFKVNDMDKVNEIHLLHLSDNNSDEKEFKKAVQKITGKPVYIGRG